MVWDWEEIMTSPHGHVTPRPDGVRARCGGPGLCGSCAQELEAQKRQVLPAPPAPLSPRQALGELLAALERAKQLARIAADSPEMPPGARARAKDAECYVAQAADHLWWAKAILDGPEAIRQANVESWRDYDEGGVG